GVLPVIIGEQDVGVILYGCGISQKGYRIWIPGSHLIHPNSLRAEYPGHFCHYRCAPAVSGEMEWQLCEGFAAHSWNQSRRKQGVDGLRRDDRRGGDWTDSSQRGPIQRDDDLARIRSERIIGAAQKCLGKRINTTAFGNG